MNNARDEHEYRHKLCKIGPSHLSNEHGDLSFLCFPKQCLVQNIQGKFPKNSSVTLIFEESPSSNNTIKFDDAHIVADQSV